MKNIAILGATGILGRPVAEAFLQSSFEVVILARNVKKAQQLFPGANIREADLKNADSLRQALQGIEGLYLSLHSGPDTKPTDWQAEREGLQTILPICRELGIQRLGYLASLVQRYQGMQGFDWWVFRLKNAALETIRQSGIPYFIFSPSTFMENFTTGAYVQGNKIMVIGKSKQPMWFIAGQDYGRMVVRAFERHPAGNREYVIQGPESFTQSQAAELYLASTNRTGLQIQKLPLWPLNLMKTFVPTLRYGTKILHALNEYPEQFAGQSAWEELGTPTITLKEFASLPIE